MQFLVYPQMKNKGKIMRLSLYRLNISEVRQILLDLENHLNKHQKEILDDLVKKKNQNKQGKEINV